MHKVNICLHALIVCMVDQRELQEVLGIWLEFLYFDQRPPLADQSAT